MGARRLIPVYVITLCIGQSPVGAQFSHPARRAATCVSFDSVFAPHTTRRIIGDESALLASIADVALSDRGYLLIADPIDANVKLYDDVGRWLRTLGRPGDGPGELRQPTALALKHDSVFVLDTHHARLSVFSIDGPFLKSVPIRVNGPTGLGLSGDSLLLIAGHGRVDEPNAPDIQSTLHVVDLAGSVQRSYRPPRRREHLYEANFSAALLDVYGTQAVVGDRTSNSIRVVNIATDSVQHVTLTPDGYVPPRWPRRRFTGTGAEPLRKLTNWANAQSWLMGVWYLEPGFVLGRFSNPTVRHRGRYALAAVGGGPAPRPICPSSTKVVAVVNGRDVITYDQVGDTTDLQVRYVQIVR